MTDGALKQEQFLRCLLLFSVLIIFSILFMAVLWLSTASRVFSSPNKEFKWKNRSSSTAVKCAVVRPVSPAATPHASRTTTDLPSFCSKYAVVRPAIPAPTIHTSVVMEFLNWLKSACIIFFCHTEIDSFVPRGIIASSAKFMT